MGEARAVGDGVTDSNTPSMSDRKVHARSPEMEVVRYDRAGKWYLEPEHFSLPAQHVTVKEAARYAVWAANEANGQIFTGLPGGAMFDRLVARGL